MNRVAGLVCVFSVLFVVAGCMTIAAPGAEQVVITRKPADVASCAAKGNIELKVMQDIDPLVAKNMAVGLGANFILDTGTGGIAYQCTK
jgi:hypothetical protein